MSDDLLMDRIGNQWVIWFRWDEAGLARRKLLASSPCRDAIAAAYRLMGGQ